MTILTRAHSLEAVEYNHDSPFASALVRAIIDIRREQGTKSRVDSNAFKAGKLSDVVKRFTKMSVKIEMEDGLQAYVRVPMLNKNNVLFKSIVHSYGKSTEADRILAAKNAVKGGVDLKNGTVSGDFVDCFSHIVIGERILSKTGNYTPEECTAVILHEVGHALVSMEMAARYTKTNFILLEGVHRLMNANSKEVRVKILREIESAYDQPIESIETYAEEQRDPSVHHTLVLQLAAAESTSQLGFNIYDVRTFEQLADQYAARQGMGVHLATALAKIYEAFGDSSYRGTIFHTLLSVVKFVLWTSMFLLSAGAILAGTFTVLELASLGFGIAFLFTNPTIMDYDKPKDRLDRIKQEMRGELRNKSLTPEEKSAILSDIKVIDTVMEKLHLREGVYEFIWSRVFPWGRKQAAQTKVQQDLEKLLNNPLYQASAQLSIA